MDEAQIERTLTIFARASYANNTLAMAGAGIHIFMALYGLYVFVETAKPLRKGRRRYIAASLGITVLSTLSASLDIANGFQTLLKSSSSRDWLRLLKESQDRQWKHLLSSAAMGGLLMIGDAFLVYRCYIICNEYWWVAVLPGITSLGALVLFFIGSYLTGQRFGSIAGATSNLLTVTTSVMVTGLIVFRLLRARRTLSQLLPSANLRLYTGVAALLIESALPLSLFGIVSSTLQQKLTNASQQTDGFLVCYALFTGLFYSFCSLSPHMIIFRVTTGRSFIELPTGENCVGSSPLRFLHQTAEPSSLQSTHTRELNGDV